MSEPLSLHIVGLGPGRASLLTGETRALLDSGLPVILRTRHHPTIDELPNSASFRDCDDLYRSGSSFEQVYASIVERVLTQAASGESIYAVPGNPLVAESTVRRIFQEAAPRRIEVRVYPALSYADAAATALRIDAGAFQLCDALDLRIDPERPALVAQLFDRDRVAALKLGLLAIYPAEHEVTVLSGLATEGERLWRVPLAELDHRPFGYLDSLFVPAIAPIDDVRRFDGLAYVIQRLHAPDGCPWDREQTHESLRPHLIEESYEALEAIDANDPDRLVEELGDVLLQVLMHAAVAERLDEFTFADVSEHLTRKLIRRHPHVFGEGTARTADEVYQNWEALKQQEKPQASILEGVPASLPALAASQSIQGRARRIGFDWPDIEGPLDKLAEEIGEFARAEGANDREDEFGDVLFVVANIAQRLGVDAEQALRRANAKFRRRFGSLEQIAAGEGIELKRLDLAGLDALWDRAKAAERL